MADFILSVDELDNICRKHQRIIIYGAGVVGSLLVQYILRTDYSDRLLCVTVTFTRDNPNNILGVPVCELRNLESYKMNTLFIVGTYENLQIDILKNLEDFGCLIVAKMSDQLCSALRKGTTNFSVEIYNMLHKENCQLRTIYKKITQLESEINTLKEMNEVCEVNFKAFRAYENKFKNKEVVIVGAGPTLNFYTPIEGAIHIGVNTVYRYEKVHLDYLFVQDANRKIDYKGKYRGIEKLSCPVFVGRYLRESRFKDIEFPENYRMNQNIYNYYLDISPSKHIYRDICFHPLMDFGSVIFAAIHFALYTYPKKLYLVGCDVSSEGYFFRSDYIVQRNPQRDRKKEWFPGYQRVKEYVQIHYPDMEVISINPVGLKGLFYDIYTDNYLNEHMHGETENE